MGMSTQGQATFPCKDKNTLPGRGGQLQFLLISNAYNKTKFTSTLILTPSHSKFKAVNGYTLPVKAFIGAPHQHIHDNKLFLYTC